MNKRLAANLSCCIAAILLIGCSGRSNSLPISADRMSAYTAVYTADNAEGGGLQISLSQDEAGNWVVSSDLQAPTGTMQSQVNLRSDFTPATSQVWLDAGGSQYEITGTYEEKRLLLAATTPNGPQSIERNLVRPYYDNEQLVAMLPALDLEVGKRYKFVLVATQSATKLTPTVYLATGADGEALVEQVTIPSGTADCQVIKFDSGVSGTSEQTFWVTTRAPFLVAKMDNGTMSYGLTEVK